MNEPFGEERIDYGAVMAWISGHTLGDENFAVFGCPRCPKVLLIEYEVGFVFPDATSPAKRTTVDDLECPECGNDHFPGRLIGPRAAVEYVVSVERLRASEWAWIEK